MQRFYRWQGVSSHSQNEVINDLKTIIASADGAITNFQLFSDLDLGLSIEIPQNKLDELFQGLQHVVSLSEAERESHIKSGSEEVVLFLNISFSKGSGDLRREVPNVPG